MKSLKAFLPVIADTLGTTPNALYTRQLALMGLGVLEVMQGRGPGSGAPLNAHNLAALLIAFLATTDLSEIDDRVARLMRAKEIRPPAPPPAPDSRQTFLAATAAALYEYELATAEHPFAGGLHTIRVEGYWQGELVKDLAPYTRPRIFKVQKPPSPGAIRRLSEYDHNALYRIQTQFAEATE